MAQVLWEDDPYWGLLTTSGNPDAGKKSVPKVRSHLLPAQWAKRWDTGGGAALGAKGTWGCPFSTAYPWSKEIQAHHSSLIQLYCLGDGAQGEHGRDG